MLKKMWNFILKFLFGDDIFISYARADGGNYATGLANELVDENFSCKFDSWGTESSRVIPDSLKKSLKRCSILVVVGTEAAAQNENIKTELEIFENTGRPIIPIIFDGVRLNEDRYCDMGKLQTPKPDQDRATASNSNIPIRKAIWAESISGQSISCELTEALESGSPSKGIVRRISNSYKFSRKDQRLKKASMAAATVLSLLVAVSVGAAMFASYQTTEASMAAGKAAEANHRAQEALTNANKSELNAAKKAKEAQDASDLAGKKTNEANKAAEQAKIEKQNAANQKRIADEQKRKAENASRIASKETQRAIDATQTAANETEKAKKAIDEGERVKSNISRNYYISSQISARNEEPLKSIHWIQKAIEKAPPNDENIGLYKLWALSLIREKTPKFIITPQNGIRDLIYDSQGDRAITVLRDNALFTLSGISRFETQVWNLKTGEKISNPIERNSYAVRGRNLLFSPSGKYIAALTAGESIYGFLLWEAENGKKILSRDSKGSTSLYANARILGFAPDSKGIIIEHRKNSNDDDAEIQVLDVNTGNEIRSLRSQRRFVNFPNTKMDIQISNNPKRNWIITYKTEDGKEVAVIRDLFTGDEKGKILVPENLEYINFTGGGKRVVIVYKDKKTKQKMVCAYDIESDSYIKPTRFVSLRFGRFGSEYDIVGFSKDDNRLIVKGTTGSTNIDTLEFWNLDKKGNGGDFRFIGSGEFLEAFFINDEKQIAAVSKHYVSSMQNRRQIIMIFDVESKKRTYYKEMDGNLKISSSGDSFFQRFKNSISVWDTKKFSHKFSSFPKFDLGKNECLLKAVRVPQQNAVITFSKKPCEGRIAFVGDSLRVKMQLWDLQTGKPQWNPQEEIEIELPSRNLPEITFSPTRKRFATLVNNHTRNLKKNLAIWETETGKSIFKSEPAEITVAWFDKNDESKINTFEYAHRDMSGNRIYKINQRNLSDGKISELGELNTGNNYIYGATKNGKFAILFPSGLRGNLKEFTVKSLENESINERYIFGEPKKAFAVQLLMAADKVSLNQNNEITAEFDNRYRIWITSSRTFWLEKSDGDIRQIVVPEAPLGGKSDLISDGNFILSSYGNRFLLYTSKTNLPGIEIRPLVRFVYAEFLSELRSILTIDRTGNVNLLEIGSMTNEVPFWIADMGKTLSGTELVDEFHFTPLGQNDYLEIRKRYIERLKAKSAEGDWDTRFILDYWSPEN